jgi:hypothetical protein
VTSNLGSRASRGSDTTNSSASSVPSTEATSAWALPASHGYGRNSTVSTASGYSPGDLGRLTENCEAPLDDWSCVRSRTCWTPAGSRSWRWKKSAACVSTSPPTSTISPIPAMRPRSPLRDSTHERRRHM